MNHGIRKGTGEGESIKMINIETLRTYFQKDMIVISEHAKTDAGNAI